MVGAIVSVVSVPRQADHQGDVVVAPQETTGIDVERLAGRVGVDVRREARVQAPPGLCPRLPWISLADLNTFASQEVREREVVPQCVAGEVDAIQRVPAKVPAQARAAEERGPRVLAR